MALSATKNLLGTMTLGWTFGEDWAWMWMVCGNEARLGSAMIARTCRE